MYQKQDIPYENTISFFDPSCSSVGRLVGWMVGKLHFHALIGSLVFFNVARPTNQPTEMMVDGEVTLPIRDKGEQILKICMKLSYSLCTYICIRVQNKEEQKFGKTSTMKLQCN